jgi:hypothetical protein
MQNVNFTSPGKANAQVRTDYITGLPIFPCHLLSLDFQQQQLHSVIDSLAAKDGKKKG